MPEDYLKNIAKVYHISQPIRHFPDEVQNGQIFGIKNFYNLKLVPIKLECSGRAVVYTTEDMMNCPDAPLLKETLTRDQYEYFKTAQMEMSNKFLDTLAYRQVNHIITDGALLRALQYYIYSAFRYFNYFIDFNELNRISLLPPKQALKELYPLYLAQRMNHFREEIARSVDKKDYMPKAREWFLDSFKMKNPPEATPSYMGNYLMYYYDYVDNKINEDYYKPWEKKNNLTVNIDEMKEIYESLRYPEKPKTDLQHYGMTEKELIESFKQQQQLQR